MGIFCEESAEDIKTIEHIVGTSISFYRDKVHGLGTHYPDIDVDLSGDFEHISEVGGRIVSEVFEGVTTALQQVAILLVLCNAFPVFKLRRHNRPLLDLSARKDFLSRFTCIFVQAGLWPLRVESQGRLKQFRWRGFPTEFLRDELLTYLQWIPPVKVTAAGADGRDETETLAHLALGCAIALEHCVELVDAEDADIQTALDLKDSVRASA